MIKKFMHYYKPYKGLFMLDFFSAVIVGILELVFPLIINKFIDDLLPSGNWTLILSASLGLLAVYLLTAFLQYVVTYWGHVLGINIETDMRTRLFAHVQRLSFRYFDNNKTGHLMSRLTNDLMDIGELAHHGPEDVFIAIMTLIGAFGVMATINWKLALITFIIVPFLLWVAVYFSQKMKEAIQRLLGDIADFNARIENNIGGIRVVQAFANEKFEMEQFATYNGRFRLAKMLSYKIMAKNAGISFMLMRLVTMFVLISGTWFVLKGELTYGEFVGFVLVTNVLFKPVEKINTVIELYPKGFAGFKRYLDLLETEPDIVDKEGAQAVATLKGDIEYKNVSFRYEKGQDDVLSNVSFSIKAGETIAFVGPSGAGKTTLCSLLPRFYEAASGEITIDGHSIRNVTLQSLRQQIGIVQQDVFLFAGTIRENIMYGKHGASEAEVWAALEHAKLGEMIRSLPNGLDTVIGERGVKLSGGQKQRLAIARMFLKNPPILILDEATSALDTETEQAIQQSLADLAVGRTTLVIAHRLATIQNADRIVVVTKDGIAEQGTHEQLLAEDGIYKRLHDAQFQGA